MIKAKIKQYVNNLIINPIISKVESSLQDSITIESQLKLQATQSSVKYILEKMNGAIAFSCVIDLYDFISQQSVVKQNILEFGVYKGDSINYFARKLPSFEIYGFDSFEGLPENWREGFQKGEFSLNGNLPNVEKNVKLIKGWFSNTLPQFNENTKIDSIGILHIDCDLYSSTKTILDYLDRKIVPGTIIIFDEYFNYPYWEHHEFKAFKEFIVKHSVKYKYLAYNKSHEQVAIQIVDIKH